MQRLDELAEVLEFQAQRLREHEQYQQGLECLIGFLLAQLQTQPGWSAECLLAALEEEQLGQLEVDPDVTVLLPFERLALQLASLAGHPIAETDLPKALRHGYPRLDAAPRGLRPVNWPGEHDG